MLFPFGIPSMQKLTIVSLSVLVAILSTAVVPAQTASQELSAYQLKVVSRLKKCPDGFQAESLKNSQFFRVGDRKYVVQVMCFLAAYQGGYEYYLYTETSRGIRSKPLKVLFFDEDAGKRTRTYSNAIVGLPTYNSATRELVIFNKYRGIGDCGTLGTYQFQNDVLVLKKFQAKYACDGNFIEPDQYPVIYP
ncbi:hypothetical protein BST81_02755 [Leptolyngbya sp. 'hensonii']|uniref:DUF1176 domain-containing protein n=1 Tax=Leptolyngbya sp. 'hensonii' TaxID=1922337 RepID=UPI00094FEAC1|nr:DUF1176 domain-containing protein [Leptolyngbya sp. 'hensonii']OLP20010.1 hypothetical protein BST81_02755 [Leptolyngbya sp. 'hensonii']